MFNRERCYNGGNKHNFKPRFSEKPTEQGISKVKGCSPKEVRTFIFYDVYEKDICVWCGKEVIK